MDTEFEYLSKKMTDSLINLWEDPSVKKPTQLHRAFERFVVFCS